MADETKGQYYCKAKIIKFQGGKQLELTAGGCSNGCFSKQLQASAGNIMAGC